MLRLQSYGIRDVEDVAATDFFRTFPAADDDRAVLHLLGLGDPLQILRDPDHRWPLLVRELDHLERQAAAAGSRQLHCRAHLGEQARLAALFEALHDRLEDHERHARQALELLVAVDSPFEIDLAEPFEADSLGHVDEVAHLHGVAREEGDGLQEQAPSGVLAGERLDEPRQFGVEEVDQGPRNELCYPAAAALAQHPALDDRPLVVALHVLQAGLVQQRAERAVDHP